MKILVYSHLVFIFGVLEVTSTGNNCPYEGCECIEYELACGRQNWKTLPPLLTTHLDGLPFLSLENNPLTTITAGSLPSGLSGINFENNPIFFIDDTAFDGSSNTLRQLMFLNASFIRIPNAIAHLNGLTDLFIENTQIRDWNVDVLKHIGLTLTSLSLLNVSLSSWPAWIQYFPHLQELELTSSFTTVPNNTFDNQINTLTSLSLTNGNLSESPFVISKLAVLNVLVLDNNRISKIAGLPGFGKLSSLSLNSNNFSDVRHLSDALRSVSDSLEEMRLEGNQLTAFPDLSFMTKLQRIYLSNNHISDTISGSISSSVTQLDLQNNYLRSFSTFLLKGGSLQTLQLSMNFIMEISGADIPSNIVELDFTNNLLTELKDTCFPQNSSLELITLDLNPISKISSLAFVGLSYMRFLSLRSTKLTRLPLALSSLTGLLTLDMSQSAHLICTCLEKPLRTWALTRGLSSFGDCGQTSITNFLQNLSADCPDLH